MSNYIVADDLLTEISEQLLIQLTDDSNTGFVDADIIAAAIVNAESEVDGYVGARYEVPVVPAPDLLKKLSIDISVKNLVYRRQRIQQDVTTSYTNAVALLKNIALGVVKVPGGIELGRREG